MTRAARNIGILAGCALGVFIVARLSNPGDADVASGNTVRPADVPAIRAKAEQGDAQAETQLGRLYAQGHGVPHDYGEAARWYRRAADQGDADAQTALGELYEVGQGVAQGPADAAKWYRLAAAQGNTKAQYDLGVMCEFGRGVPKDQAQAAKWFRQAADRGDALAQFNLGQRCDLGIGVPADRIEACKWLSLAAAQGLADADGACARVKSKMSHAEISEAKRRVAAFVSQKTAHSLAR